MIVLEGPARFVTVDPSDYARVITQEVWVDDCYHFATHAPGATVIDLGANIGISALAAIAHGAIRVIAVEPDSINREALVENLVRNDVDGLVDVYPNAVAGREGSRIMRREAGVGDSFSGSGWADPSEEPGAARVRAFPLESFVPAEATRLVLKVDIEGSEYDVFDGTPAWLLARFEFVAIEYHSEPDRGLDSSRRLPGLLARLLPTHDFTVAETFAPGVGMVRATQRERQ